MRARRLIVHLKLRPVDPHAPADKTKYVITEHEDFYHQEDLAALVVPPLVPLVRTALSAATLSCRILAWGFSNVLGYWRVRDGEAGKGVKLDPRGESLPDGGEDELKESRNGKGGKREKKSSGGSYAEAAREAVGEMQDKGLNAI